MTTARYLAFFRQAREARSGWNLTKTLAQVLVFWFVFLVAIPRGLVALEQALGVPPMRVPVGDTLAWVVFVAASALGLASGTLMALDGGGTPLPFDAPRHLVLRGPYRYVRNPMAIAGLAQGACVAVLLDSWFTVGLVVAGFVVWNYVVRPLEEAHLEAMFGESFRQYRRRVRCWFP
jgi:protein-S-isoprenylcysteine O-methyltransferase Ste14